jgi:uncharacterized protein (DUF2147 family)
MKKIIVLATLLCGTISAAATPSPTGTWQSANGDSRYEVAMCGDGKSLCARLTWLRQDVRTPKNMQYLDKWVVRAEPAGANTWRGAVNLHGTRASGKVTLKDADTMHVHGCRAIFCQSMQFNRL